MSEVNEAVIVTYLAGGNTRRIRSALRALLKAAPVSKSAVSRVVATPKDELEAWRRRSLAALDVIYLYLDGFALRARSAGKLVSVPVLGWSGSSPTGANSSSRWSCAGASLSRRGRELLTFFRFPKSRWKTLRTTNVIERLHGEFRRRVKTQGSLPSEDAALILLFSLVASGQIKLRRIDGWRKIAVVLSQQSEVA